MKIKRRMIRMLDWFDDRILRHNFYRLGLCDWIATSSWWGEPTILYDDMTLPEVMAIITAPDAHYSYSEKYSHKVVEKLLKRYQKTKHHQHWYKAE